MHIFRLFIHLNCIYTCTIYTIAYIMVSVVKLLLLLYQVLYHNTDYDILPKFS